jgi:hypothetical protein
MANEKTIFILTREDVVNCAKEMGLPEDSITDEVLDQVKKGVEWGFESWPDVVKAAISWAVQNRLL